jgi:O-methyltransferase involved in polyketide biosynthesis
LQIFEVDHPSTQAWKRARLADRRRGVGKPPLRPDRL